MAILLLIIHFIIDIRIAMTRRIQLKSNNDEIFDVDRSVIRLSNTLNTMFQGKLLSRLSS